MLANIQTVQMNIPAALNKITGRNFLNCFFAHSIFVLTVFLGVSVVLLEVSVILSYGTLMHLSLENPNPAELTKRK